MASVHRRSLPSGRVIYRVIWKETGSHDTRRQRSKNFTRAGDARAWAAQVEQDERRGVGDPERHTVERFLRRWLASLRSRDEHSPTTLPGTRVASNLRRARSGM